MSRLRSSRQLRRFALAALPALALLPLALPATSAAAPPKCKTSGLVIWSNDGAGGGTAGSIVYKVRFTNLSGHACTLRGFPKVAAVKLNGKRVGAVAKHAAGQQAKTVKLTDGATASVQLQVIEVGNFSPSSCHPVTAAGLRVWAPGQGKSKLVPLPFETCAKSSQKVLTVGAVRAGF